LSHPAGTPSRVKEASAYDKAKEAECHTEDAELDLDLRVDFGVVLTEVFEGP
jgi:hypothetical protein